MLKTIIKKIVLRLYPELAAGMHLPILAVVTNVPDPPAGGEQCSEHTPKYAVDVRLLKNDFTIDPDMPLMRDVPVALSGAAPDRGFALIPQPGTIVELAFAFGLQTHPYIRAVLPHGLKLPKIDATSMRWQQSAVSFQQVDAGGHWRRETTETITDQAGTDIIRAAGQKVTETAGMEYSMQAPKIWLGSPADNFLQIVSDFMAATITAFSVVAAHTHTGNLGNPTSPPETAKEISANGVTNGSAAKARLEIIKK